MRMLIGAILCAATFSAAGQLYRWTDESGKTHFGDLPPASAKNVQKKSAPAPGAGTPGEPFVLRQARDNFPVTLYTTPGCEACTEARKLLNARGVPFKEVSVTQENLAELRNAVGSNSVPALLVGNSAQNGFEAGAYHQLLDNAGYPKPGILPARNQSEPKPAAPEAESEPAEAPVRGPYAPRR